MSPYATSTSSSLVIPVRLRSQHHVLDCGHRPGCHQHLPDRHNPARQVVDRPEQSTEGGQQERYSQTNRNRLLTGTHEGRDHGGKAGHRCDDRNCDRDHRDRGMAEPQAVDEVAEHQ